MQQFVSYVDLILIYIIFGVSINLALGYAGILQASPAAFGAFGGYAVVYLTSNDHMSFPLALLIGVAAACLVGFVVGLPVLRLDGFWVLLLTLSVGLVIGELLEGLNVFGGDNGVISSVNLYFFGEGLNEPTEALPFIAVITVIVFALGWRLGESPYGRVLRGLRADQLAVYSLGKNVVSYKLAIFTITCALAGLAGGLLSMLTQVANPGQFNLDASVEVIAVIIIGGVGNLVGTVVGATIVVLLTPFFQEVIHFSPEVSANVQLIAYGLVLTLVVLFRPKGAIPEGVSLLRGIRRLAGWPARMRSGPIQPAAASAAAASAVAAPERNGHRRLDVATVHDPVRRAADPASIILDVRDVSKAFGGVRAVNGLSMQLQRSAITALVGPNGAGKTTVFNLLTGALPLDAGQVFLKGNDITGLRPDQVAHLGMVRSFQDVRVFAGMSVLDNVLLGIPRQAGEHLIPLFFRPRQTSASEKAAREQALHWLDFVGLADIPDVRVDTIGFGQQKLVTLARVLATNAEILLLDEPASGIDYQRLDDMLELISEVRDEGRTVCIVEHNLDVVSRLADHVYFMELGAVTAEGSFTELTSNPRLAEAYFGAA
jgi:branched-chain amino acid transport system permease protein